MSNLELGAQIPAWHWDYGPSELRDWVQGAEALGFDWLAMTDHVLYAYELPDRPPQGPYVGETNQHETLTTLAYLGACTERVTLQSAVLVLPQREPVLVAKQAAEIDVLTGGRFRLGVGIGWQEPEFAAMGANFRQRPSRVEEAVAVLRACWTQEPVDFEGRYTTIESMSMVPKPVTPGGPPIIFGGSAKAASERAARIADGWIGLAYAGPDVSAKVIGGIRAEMERNGRDPEQFLYQWSTPLQDDIDALRETFLGHQASGVRGFGVGMPSYDPDARIDVEDYLKKLEIVVSEVWPAVKDREGSNNAAC